jgi:hypothetical protein
MALDVALQGNAPGSSPQPVMPQDRGSRLGDGAAHRAAPSRPQALIWLPVSISSATGGTRTPGQQSCMILWSNLRADLWCCGLSGRQREVCR